MNTCVNFPAKNFEAEIRIKIYWKSSKFFWTYFLSENKFENSMGIQKRYTCVVAGQSCLSDFDCFVQISFENALLLSAMTVPVIHFAEFYEMNSDHTQCFTHFSHIFSLHVSIFLCFTNSVLATSDSRAFRPTPKLLLKFYMSREGFDSKTLYSI